MIVLLFVLLFLFSGSLVVGSLVVVRVGEGFVIKKGGRSLLEKDLIFFYKNFFFLNKLDFFVYLVGLIEGDGIIIVFKLIWFDKGKLNYFLI